MNFTILQLQYFQEMHDKVYHTDIYKKTLMGRLTHLHQHLVKYNSDELSRNGSYTKAIACIFSMSNALNCNLANIIEIAQRKTVVHIDDIEPQYKKEILIDRYTQKLAMIAKQLEAFDHVERTNYREVISGALCDMLVILLQIADEIDEWDIPTLIASYIADIFELKRFNMFYPYLRNADLADPIYRSFEAFNNRTR